MELNKQYDLKISKDQLNKFLEKFEVDKNTAYLFPYDLVDKLEQIIFYEGRESVKFE